MLLHQHAVSRGNTCLGPGVCDRRRCDGEQVPTGRRVARPRPATLKRTVRLRSGKSKLLVPWVKPKARRQVAKRKRLLVRQKVHAGKVTATVTKSRRLIRR